MKHQVMSRKRGRSKKGKPAYFKSSVIKGINISLIAAISPSIGLVHYTTHEYSDTYTGVTSKVFISF